MVGKTVMQTSSYTDCLVLPVWRRLVVSREKHDGRQCTELDGGCILRHIHPSNDQACYVEVCKPLHDSAKVRGQCRALVAYR
eukprot:1387-Eustigmatos_ZCMA.PRE.1